MNRRDLLLVPAVLVPAVAAGGATYAVVAPQRDRAQAQAAELQAQIARLQKSAADQKATLDELQRRVDSLPQRWVASGGGTNRKMMPDAPGQPTVELLEVFSFDRNHAYCRVDTNPQGFVMPTYKMGKVAIPAQSFFMSMGTTTIDQFDVKQLPDGKLQALLRGSLDCHTEVETAELKVGSRTVAEPAAYEITAVDGGPGGGRVGDSFAFTVFFDERDAPLNFAIFGPTFTFTGEMVEGEITIRNLATLAP